MTYTLSGFTQEEIESMYQQMVDDTLPQPEADLSQFELDCKEIKDQVDTTVTSYSVSGFISAKIYESVLLNKRLINQYQYARLVDNTNSEPIGCVITNVVSSIQNDLSEPLPDFVHEIVCDKVIDRTEGVV